MTEIAELMTDIGKRARAACRVLAMASHSKKTQALMFAADRIHARREEIIAANALDIEYGREKGLNASMLDRLALDQERLEAMCQGLRTVAEQPDPVGEIIGQWTRPNGLDISRVRTPIGVIGVIYESRPNVTVDAGALCLKSGNAAILRGGSEGLNSALALHSCLVEGLEAAGLPRDAIQIVPSRDRAAVSQMLTMTDYIDVIVPRGGKGLVGLVQREARVPVFAHLEGIVHIYLDKDADPTTALAVVLNAKTRRTSICGAVECILVHRDIVETVGQGVIRALLDAEVEVRGDARLAHIPGVSTAGPEDWGREYLDRIIAAKVVDDLDGAIAHIRRFGSDHTDCIVSEDAQAVERFFNELDSAILMHNTSTQFADGGEFGMGAEIGIATGRLHARGPVGAQQLTTFQYHVTSEGAVRN